MSCNGCRILRRRCSDNCTLRACLDGIDDPRAQGNATLFVSKFFGRSDLMSFISAVPQNRRPALFKSLLFEACGRTVNPVTGVVGLLTTGNWHVCQKAVQTVLAGGNPLSYGGTWDIPSQFSNESGSDHVDTTEWIGSRKRRRTTSSFGSETELSELDSVKGEEEPKLLNLFV